MFLLFYKVLTHVRLVIVAMRVFVYVHFLVEGMYTCKTGHFVNKTFFIFLFVVEGMYSCKTGHLGKTIIFVYVFVVV